MSNRRKPGDVTCLQGFCQRCEVAHDHLEESFTLFGGCSCRIANGAGCANLVESQASDALPP